ncbi:MAG TPA: acyltransferase [Hyphomonadaceae bacterium]|jgi:peptidoglycan/LPS O-acetylase OafA/YrhL|nr:acyltransferase [Hyphomonadaceae bacterium]
MPADNRRYLLLDAMRGVAAFAVLWGHLTSAWDRPDLHGPQYALAVDFFFILSGFVIGHAYAQRMKQGMSALEFIRIRVIRLYPLLIAGALIGTAVALVRHAGENGYTAPHVLESGVFAMLGLPSFAIPGITLAFPVNSPAWSLFFELCVSLLFAFIARFLTRSWLIAIVVAGAALFAAAALQEGSVEMGWERDGLLGGATRVVFGFFAGLLLHDLRPRFSLPPWAGYFFSAVLGAVLFEPHAFWVHGNLMIAIVGFPILVWLGSAVRESGFIARAGGLLGALSYPVYILHWPIIDLTRGLFGQIDPEGRYLALWAPLQIALAVSIAWLAMKLYDEPVRAWLTRATRRKPAAPMAAA